MGKIRVHVPEVPLMLTAARAEVEAAGLGQAPGSDEKRIFIFFTDGAGSAAAHLSIDNAAFLRDAIDTVLGEYRAMEAGAN